MTNEFKQEVIGLIPAAGQGSRISPLPCSKEIYPVGFRHTDRGSGLRPKVVCHYLLEKMRAAGVTKAYIVLREGKWDIPQYFRDGAMVDMHLSYLFYRVPLGAPYTLDAGYPFVKNSMVAFGFPDILFRPADAFVRILSRQAATEACITLGLFPAKEPQTVDMVDLGGDGRVRRIVIKPDHTELSFTWAIAVWTPVFTEFLHDFVVAHRERASTSAELGVGEVIQAAIDAGLKVEGLGVSAEPCLDVGTPENLAYAVNRYAQTD